jgi:Mrp family chromosome partitioning ATPase
MSEFDAVSSRAYERTHWTGGGRLVARLQETGRHVTDTLAGWLDSALGLASRDGHERHGRVDLGELARQEEIKLVQQLFLMPGSKAPLAVLFAGVERDNGCAGICIRAGQTLARLKPQSVCVVDANPRSPMLNRLVGADNESGLATAACSAGAAPMLAWRLAPDNLWLLPAGSVPSDPDSFPTADRVRPCIQELGATFQHILINGPPVTPYAAPLALSQAVDGVVLVLEANVTRREIVRACKSSLEDRDIPLLGIVLNDRTFPIPQALYRLI